MNGAGFVILEFCSWPIAVPSGKKAPESMISIRETKQEGLEVCLNSRWRYPLFPSECLYKRKALAELEVSSVHVIPDIEESLFPSL